MPNWDNDGEDMSPSANRGERGKYFTKWDDVLELGRVSDRSIARRLGVSTHSVAAARRRRGMGPWAAPVRYTLKLSFYVEFNIWDQLETLREKHGLKYTSCVARQAIKAGLPHLFEMEDIA